MQDVPAAVDSVSSRLDALMTAERSAYPDAVRDLLDLRDTCRLLKRDSCLFDIYVHTGLFLEAQGLLDSAMAMYEEGTTILRTLGDSAGVVRMRFMRAQQPRPAWRLRAGDGALHLGRVHGPIVRVG